MLIIKNRSVATWLASTAVFALMPASHAELPSNQCEKYQKQAFFMLDAMKTGRLTDAEIDSIEQKQHALRQTMQTIEQSKKPLTPEMKQALQAQGEGLAKWIEQMAMNDDTTSPRSTLPARYAKAEEAVQSPAFCQKVEAKMNLLSPPQQK